MTEPLADMNPILLKPTNDIGSQVIVQGVSIGNMPAREYFAYKKTLIPKIMESFHRLEENFDVIVIEGAGSSCRDQSEKRRHCQYGNGRTGGCAGDSGWRY